MENLKIRLFNVGQGDHLLLELPDRSFGILDFFYDTEWAVSPSQVFLQHVLDTQPERKIKIAFICMSHPDLDHVKGVYEFLSWAEEKNILIERIWRYPGPDPEEMNKILEKFQKKNEYITGVFKQYRYLSPQLKAIHNYIEKNKIHVEYLQDIRTLANKIANVAEAKCLGPLGKHIQPKNGRNWVGFIRAYLKEEKFDMKEKNILSSIVQLVFDDFNLLFGGDTELKIWLECIEHSRANGLKINWPSEFIKISHHGSKCSSSLNLWEEILSNINTYVGISAGRSSHPSPETIEHINQTAISKNKGVELLTTSLCDTCLSKSLFNTVDSYWIENVIKNEEEEETIKSGRSEPYKGKPDGKRLVSYIITFSLEEKIFSIEKEVCETDLGRTCIYDNSDKGLFPLCL